MVISSSLSLHAVSCQFNTKKNTLGPCRQLKTAKVTRVTNERITIGYDNRHWVAPTAEEHSALAPDIGHVIWTYCSMQRKSWKAMPDEVRMKVHTLLSTNYNFDDINDDMLAYVALETGCPKEFEDREDNWVWLCSHFQEPSYVIRGSKFPEIDVFCDVYIRSGDELTESLHATMMEKRQLIFQESASQLPPKTSL
ncbi:hypothetical protein C1H46_012544 [Malus baccata]|uniref:Uncharacterized protein n=1 Tax=Malus baccata TaxID=106549 RepID=A0A540MU74_MALBA|nr:hypothetical protein C1H46_012544 [Malus baccata]